MGADDLIANGKKVAVIEYHSTELFANAASMTRNNIYRVSGWPMAYFDGTYIGCGSPTTSCYNTYLPIYNTKYAIPSDFTIQMTATHTGLNYNLHVVVTKVGNCNSTNLRLICGLTQSNIPYNWGPGLTKVNFAERIMMPSSFGSTIDFCGGTTMSFDLPFTIDGNWPLADLELVAYVQDFNTKEVFQGTKSPILTVGITEPVINTFNLNVYPNPMSSTATVAFDLKEASNAVINIYDIVGKVIFTHDFGFAKQGINMVDFDGTNFNAGMYIVKLIVNDQTSTTKISINK